MGKSGFHVNGGLWIDTIIFLIHTFNMAVLSYHFQVNGLSVFVREKTPTVVSQTLLILHGWNTDGAQKWMPFMQHFPLENTRILAIDMPGFAQSEKPKTVWDAHKYAMFISEFISQKIGTPVHILGHSFGGAVAAVVAAQYSHQIQSLSLCAPAIVRSSTPSLITRMLSGIASTFSPLKAIPGVAIVWLKITGSTDYSATPQGIMQQIMQTVIRTDLQHELAGITAPTMIIWGTQDTYTPYSQAKLIQSHIADSHLVTLKNINHGIHLHALPRLMQAVMKHIE